MLPLYLVYLIIVTLVVTGVSFSKYGTIVDGTDTARVAKPVLEYVPTSATFRGQALSSLSEGLSFTDVKPGDELIYTFDIRNYEGEGLNKVRNEVLLKYNIVVSVQPENELPLSTTLGPTLPDITYPSAGSGWTILGLGEDITHSYTLRILWNAAETGSVYANKTQTIRITINAEQID
jgi:hypothetical protein